MTRLLHAGAFSAVIAASGVLTAWGVLGDMPGKPYLMAFLEQFSHAFVISGVVAAIIAAVETSPLPGVTRALIQSAALAAGVVGAAFAIAAIGSAHSVIARMGVGTAEGLIPHFLWIGLASAVLFSWYYAVRERASAAIDSLAAESMRRHAALRRAGEERLRALRAQVDPAALDARLARIHEAYREGANGGDRLLDELIEYLTRALADSRGAPTTVDQGDIHG